MTAALANAARQDPGQQMVADKMRRHAVARLAQEILELERIEVINGGHRSQSA
jgi:hypothetical protein